MTDLSARMFNLETFFLICLTSAYLCEIFIDECRIFDEQTDVRIEERAAPLWRRCQFGRLRFDSLESLGQFFLCDLIGLGLLREAFHALHQSLHSDFLITDYAGRRRWRRWDICPERRGMEYYRVVQTYKRDVISNARNALKINMFLIRLIRTYE